MKSFKSLFFLLLFISSYFQAKAQLEVSFNFALGIANMDIEKKLDTAAVDYDSKAGICIGPKVAYHFGHGLFLESGFLFKQRGYKVEESNIFVPGNTNKADITHKFNVDYLDIPLNFKFSTMSEGGANVFFMIGGYCGIALGGRQTSTLEYNQRSSSQPKKENAGITAVLIGDSHDDHIRRYDFGLSLGAGFSLGAVDVSLHYDIGQSNITPESYQDEISAKNRLFRINLALKLYSGFSKEK